MAAFALSRRERLLLEQVMADTHDARTIQRAYGLLWLDEGEAVQDIAVRLGVSRQTVYNWVERFSARKGRALEARLADAERSGRPCTVQGIIDPLIEAVIDVDPHEFGYRATVWTAPLLVGYLADHHQLRASCQSVRLAIARLKMRWKRPRHQLALRPATWQQAKGG
jgi:transposase